ncbi:hypothetical protein T4A_4488 [Trichinella pseudospiralis]|uniref:Uncharacterized protein n=1 Tax=Trichinella pseudospiralis TaxID=6337 RepID=A0A0V1KAC4_TRIPS|nr:hypothetical protein T4A_4488 [Trichinella pseudospiralis]KRZ44110.1 hypothetical protein T4C_11779 [Trichinella pseudospiralis]
MSLAKADSKLSQPPCPQLNFTACVVEMHKIIHSLITELSSFDSDYSGCDEIFTPTEYDNN